MRTTKNNNIVTIISGEINESDKKTILHLFPKKVNEGDGKISPQNRAGTIYLVFLEINCFLSEFATTHARWLKDLMFVL